jgi:hypothetical protein
MRQFDEHMQQLFMKTLAAGRLQAEEILPLAGEDDHADPRG